VFEQLASSQYAPFTATLVVVLLLLMIEGGSTLVGKSVSSLLEHVFGPGGDIDVGDAHAGDAGGADTHGHDGPLHSALSLLNVGRVPLLVLLVILLACFSASGFILQGLAQGLMAPLPGWLAALLALVPAVPATRAASRLIARLIPRDETYVTRTEEFVGRTGTVTVGPVRRGVVARMKLQDRYGNWHFPKIEPFEPEAEIQDGTLVLVVEHHEGLLRVVKAEGKLAEPH
jgi:hypothetical protein